MMCTARPLPLPTLTWSHARNQHPKECREICLVDDDMLALVMLCAFGAFLVLCSTRCASFLLEHSQRESLLRGIDAAYERYFSDVSQLES